MGDISGKSSDAFCRPRVTVLGLYLLMLVRSTNQRQKHGRKAAYSESQPAAQIRLTYLIFRVFLIRQT